MHAVKEGNFERFQRVFEDSKEKNPKNKNGWSVLHEAAKRGCHDMIHVILNNTCDELPRDSNGKSPLEVALEEGHRKASKEFLQRMKSFDLNLCIDDKSEDSLLHLAAEIGNFDLFNSILEEPGDAKAIILS